MIRRCFIQTLAAALLPRPVIVAAMTLQPGCEPSARTLHYPSPILNPEWLHEWQELPKLEIFAKDLTENEAMQARRPPDQFGLLGLRGIRTG